MNKQFKRLLERARAECSQIGSKPGIAIGYDELEKFAEAIVDECCDVVIGSDTDPKMILHEPYRSIVRDIQDHFYGEEE